jgi:predicted translin family RNA/ssDNA-binding protein
MSITGCGAMDVAKSLEQYEKICNEIIDLIENGKVTEAMVRLERKSAEMEHLMEKLAGYENIMTDSQMARFIDITIKMGDLFD